eukprot:CAMPEP_0117438570 /NCGR_PEP_ID=MMETSP0759-20121206/2120_1 /TAXON_ID=63605 /ORGANISM="Percolomonas cosmopolitus, Strain WS" /LENGTH=58 /DNA_ID=CAMNT_0005230263 /DNA_START=195 /DNA_END=371 /DNA_ORIENTATION=-
MRAMTLVRSDSVSVQCIHARLGSLFEWESSARAKACIVLLLVAWYLNKEARLRGGRRE